MKNRIWKQIKQITVAAAVAGTVLFGSVQPGMAADSELQSGQELSDDREKEDGYEHMEELASGETVCKENEAPEEESESTTGENGDRRRKCRKCCTAFGRC